MLLIRGELNGETGIVIKTDYEKGESIQTNSHLFYSAGR